METVLLEDATAHPTEVVPLTVEQYHRMRETGILAEGAPIELLNGLLVPKDRGGAAMTVSPRHALVVSRMVSLAPSLEPLGCHLRLQNPITIVPSHEPEPDGFIVCGKLEDYADRHPGPDDVLCVIEVSESSLQRDRRTKKKIYASAGIEQYVIVNLVDRRIEVYEDPDVAVGTYDSVRILAEDDTLALRAAGGAVLKVRTAQLLP